MKRAMFILLSMTCATMAFGQKMDLDLARFGWPVGTEKILFGNRILRIQGNNDSSGVINAGYQSLDQVKADIRKQAEKEKWSAEKTLNQLAGFDQSPGGLIHLYVGRISRERANLRYFTVIVRDSTDLKEIFSRDLPYQIPNLPSTNGLWWNHTMIPLPQAINGKIFIYIVDALSVDGWKFKFEVRIQDAP